MLHVGHRLHMIICRELYVVFLQVLFGQRQIFIFLVFPQMLEIRPIVVNDDMIVLGGNMRLKACLEAGLKEIPIVKKSEKSTKNVINFLFMVTNFFHLLKFKNC